MFGYQCVIYYRKCYKLYEWGDVDVFNSKLWWMWNWMTDCWLWMRIDSLVRFVSFFSLTHLPASNFWIKWNIFSVATQKYSLFKAMVGCTWPMMTGCKKKIYKYSPETLQCFWQFEVVAPQKHGLIDLVRGGLEDVISHVRMG